jgi:uncharacterized repeat protein (TIGR03803 family)
MKVVASWVFALVIATAAHADTRFSVIASFDATANTPAGALIQTADGSFAGTTTQGGPADVGTVFSMTPSGVVTVLYAFAGGPDGAYPYGGIVQSADGSLLGTTSSGGAGTVFRISATGDFSVVYTFTAGAKNHHDLLQPYVHVGCIRTAAQCRQRRASGATAHCDFGDTDDLRIGSGQRDLHRRRLSVGDAWVRVHSGIPLHLADAESVRGHRAGGHDDHAHAEE